MIIDMGIKEEALARDSVFNFGLEQVLQEAIADALSKVKRAQAGAQAWGSPLTSSQIAGCSRAISLGQELAKRMNWEIVVSGAPLIGYTCKVIPK